MLIVETIARIRRDHLDRGVLIRRIARELKLSRNTVRKAIRGDVAAFGYERTVQPLPKLGPWVGELERLMEANEGKRRRERLSLLRIFEQLQGLGYDGGYDAVRRYAMSWRWRRSGSGSQAYVPLIFDPGEAYQFDWSHEYAVVAGTTTRVKAAHLRLCHSRLFLVQIFPRESQEMVFEAHERSFRFFGGVCRRGIYDNMKTAVQTVFVGKAWIHSSSSIRRQPTAPGPICTGDGNLPCRTQRLTVGADTPITRATSRKRNTISWEEVRDSRAVVAMTGIVHVRRPNNIYKSLFILIFVHTTVHKCVRLHVSQRASTNVGFP